MGCDRPVGSRARLLRQIVWVPDEVIQGGQKKRYGTMSKGVHLDLKTTAKSKSMRSAAARVTLFGEPQLLAGEDAAPYDEFLARIRAAVNPVDIIDEMFIADVASLEWEVLRWRRLKWTLMQATGLKALNQFLVEQLES